MAAEGQSFPRLPLRRPDDDRGRAEGSRIQRPPGRSGDAAHPDALALGPGGLVQGNSRWPNSARWKPTGARTLRCAWCSPPRVIRASRNSAKSSPDYEAAEAQGGVKVFHAGTVFHDQQAADGGRAGAGRDGHGCRPARGHRARLRGGRQDPLRRHALPPRHRREGACDVWRARRSSNSRAARRRVPGQPKV